MKEYSNSQIAKVIDEYVHSKIHRDMLKRRLIDGLTFEQLAEEFHYSVRHTKYIIYKEQEKVFLHI